MDFVQVRRMRSRVDAEYKPSYNRMTFDLTGSGLASDLSESYLSFRMYITNRATGDKLDADDYQALLESDLMISFGQNGMSYPAASLIKVARLYAGGNAGSPLEEILWQNVWASTMHQLKNDFETLQSGSLSNGTTAAFSTNGSLASQISALMKSTINGQNTQLPVDVHIPLKDIFGICRNKNFVIDHPAIQSLIVELELEDVKSLFQLTAVGKKVSVPQLTLDGSANRFNVVPEVNAFTCLPYGQGDVGQPSYKYVETSFDASGNAELITPEGFHMVKGQNFQNFWDLTTPTVTQVNSIQLLGSAWDASGVLAAGYEVGNYVKLNFKWEDYVHKYQNRMIEILDYITAINIVDGVATIVLSTSYVAPVSFGRSGETDVQLDSFDLYYGYNPAGVNNTDATKAQMLLVGLVAEDATGVQTSTEEFYRDEIKVSPPVFQALLDTGILVVDSAGNFSGSACPITVSARPAITSKDASGNELGYTTPFMDYFVDADSFTGRQIYSCQSKRIPVQGVESAVLSCSAPDLSGNRVLKMKSFGFANNNSLQNATIVKDQTGATPTIIKPGTLFQGVPATIGWAVTFHKYRVNPDNGGSTGFREKDYSYVIDRAEIVLVQHSIDPTIPMSPVYSTLKCEVATIETSNLDQYNRQYVVNEPNCYNIYLLTPQYTASTQLGTTKGEDTAGHKYSYHPESLVSYSRNVNSYRWALNNIDDTNRNLEVQTNVSKYPSSLHLEKLLDTMTNDDAKLQTLSGILTVPRSHSDPVVCFPLRVYKAFDDMNTYLRPTGFTAQISLFGDSVHDNNIVEGPIFLYKQILRMIPGM